MFYRIALLGLLSVFVQTFRQEIAKREEFKSVAQNGYLPFPLYSTMFGYERVTADCLWLAFIQYIGDSPVRSSDGAKLAANFIDRITQLDPTFVEPFYFASFIIGSEQKHPQIADALINRGIQANNDNWKIPFIAGFNQYLNANDDHRAAYYYSMAARLSNAPTWLERQSRMLSSGEAADMKKFAVLSGVYSSTTLKSVRTRTRSEMTKLGKKLIEETDSPDVKIMVERQLQEFN